MPTDAVPPSDAVPPTTGRPASTVPRRRLLQRLDGHRLVVLSAPAGYGTSTLAAQLAEQRGGPVVRCRLRDADVADGGTGRLLDALSAAVPQLGDEPPVVDRTGAARLAYALADVAGPLTIVVEDLQLLDDGGDAVVPSLLETTDPTVGIVACTESMPPASVVRLAAGGAAVVLGAQDLLFDLEECATLVELVGATTSPGELLERSGGWPLAAAAILRSGTGVEEVLAADVLGELDPHTRHTLAAVVALSSVPLEALGSSAADQLRRFARRHPASLTIDADRVTVRDLLRPLLVGAAGDEGTLAAALELADRLERIGRADDALVLLSRVGHDRAALLARLDQRGAALLDAGRHAFLRRLVTEVPPVQRSGLLLVLDAAAALGLDQLEAGERPGFRVDEAALRALAEDGRLDVDLQLAVAGLRTEFLRRRGDARLVEVALAALVDVGPLDGSVAAAELVRDRHPMARRGLVQVLLGLGAAAQFSGDAAMIAEGARLAELAFRVAESSGIDAVPLRAQAGYERMLIGLEWPDDVLAPLEAGVSALESLGHPEAANLLAELADVHLRRGDAAAALTVAAAGQDWSERTGNELVRGSIAMVCAGAELLRDGPSPSNDGALEGAWAAMVAHPRLQRALPSLAVRIANAMLDHGDTARAARWMDRARARMADLVQGPYQQQFLASVEQRMAAQLGQRPTPMIGEDDLFAAQPAGRLERWATLAWDARRAGDPEPAARLASVAPALPHPWPERLGTPSGVAEAAGERVPPTSAPSGLWVCLLAPEVRVLRDGHVVATPTGHAARLLALLVVAGGSITVDAVVDELWPDADPGAARNRLHQVLHRLRRVLDVDAEGPLTTAAGVVRLDTGAVGSDVAELRSLDPRDRGAALSAVRGYTSDLCAAQFGFDDAFADARWELSARLHEVVEVLLAGSGASEPEVVAAVWDVWVRLEDEDRLGWTLADALDRSGEQRRAQDIRDRLTGRTGPPSPG